MAFYDLRRVSLPLNHHPKDIAASYRRVTKAKSPVVASVDGSKMSSAEGLERAFNGLAGAYLEPAKSPSRQIKTNARADIRRPCC